MKYNLMRDAEKNQKNIASGNIQGGSLVMDYCYNTCNCWINNCNYYLKNVKRDVSRKLFC